MSSSESSNPDRADRPYTPINKGQFTLESPERVRRFEERRGSSDPQAYKENRRLWAGLPRRQKVSDFPLHVDLELASVCNLHCPMCYTISDHFKQRVNATLMDYDLFTRVIDEIGDKVYSIRLSLRGESFLHQRIVDCVRYAKAAGIKEVSTLTNGLRLDAELFVAMMEAGMDWLTISFDGLGDVYEKIRHPAKFEEAVQKIRDYHALRANAGRQKPVIKVQSILPAIESDPGEFYDLFAPITDMVSANPLIDFLGDRSTLPKEPRFACPQIYQRLVIGADGTALMCSNDEDQLHPVGNANRSSIHDIWHGTKLTRIREIHQRQEGPACLEACNNCYLPLKTAPETIRIGDWSVTAQKYTGGKQQVKELNTPEKHRRDDLEV